MSRTLENIGYIVECDNEETLFFNLETVKYAKYDPLIDRTKIIFKDGEEIQVKCDILKRMKEGY